MERQFQHQAKTSDIQTGSQILPSFNPEDLVEATVFCIHEAITDEDIDIHDWRNVPMRKIVQSFRDQKTQIEEITNQYEQLKKLHEITKKELQEIKDHKI
jgi:hypothetical protein